MHSTLWRMANSAACVVTTLGWEPDGANLNFKSDGVKVNRHVPKLLRSIPKAVALSGLCWHVTSVLRPVVKQVAEFFRKVQHKINIQRV